MFYRIRNFFRSKTKQKIIHLEYELERYIEYIKDIKDEIILLNKLSNKKEYKVIENLSMVFFFSDGESKRNEAMEEERMKLRKEGYSFCHKKKNNDEIWAKY